ncbi:T9SS type A sorting domain-containing protein, partial [Longibacter sp.]|uniref:T9SS type A sorting domain-containing protein n=1 Tax=Longibacter sp. TaxID=2045415 RepID=UPI003EBE56BF
VVIDLTNPVSSALATTDTRLTFTLTDDESAPTVAFTQASSSGLESTNGSVEVRLSSPSSQPVEVDFGVDDAASTADRGPGDDFSLGTASPLTFSPGQTSASIVLDVNDDAQDELGETAILDLTGATGATVDAPNRHTYTIEDNDAPPFGAIGPGGVGDASTLALWLSPTDGVTEDGARRVSSWADQSGNARNVAQSSGGNRPAFDTATLNGLAVPEFDGSGQFLSNTDGADDFLTGEDAFTLFAVTRSNQAGYDQAFFDTEAPDNSDDELSLRYDDAGANSGRNDILKLGIVTSGSQGAQQLETSTSIGGRATHVTAKRIYGVRWTAGSDLQFSMDGVEDSNPDIDGAAATGSLTGADNIYVGIGTKGATGSTGWDGAVGDVIAYREPLGQTRRTIVENYLSAKYDIDLNTANGALDVYAGDTGGNGDFDRGVFGIGRTSAGDFHSAAQADGLRFDLTTGFEDGDYLLAGHATPTNSVNTADISGPAGLAARMDRIWYVDATNSGSALRTSFRFDLSDAGLAASVNPDPSGYVLLYRSGQSGSWSTVSTGGVSTTDDQITFSGVSSASPGDGYYTLGTTDRADSPLSGTAITIVGNSGDEGDATVGELGGDAGWRLIGPPVEGATAGDIISGSDTNGSVIEFTVAQGSMFYRWDDAIAGSPNDGAWSPINTASTAFQNGRGYLLFLFDDVGIPDADPLNPSITLDVATGTVPTSSITVGDGAPAGSDPALNQDAALHALANPFNEPYDLTSLEDGNGNSLSSSPDFQATVQIWDGGATTAEDNAQAGSYITATVDGTASQDGTGNMVPASDVISAWQGFFVERTTPGAGPQEFTFNNAGITTGDRRIVGSKSTLSPRPHVRIPLKLTVTGSDDAQVARDEAASVFFHPDATEEWDAFDASKLTPLTSRYALLGPVGAVRDTADAPAMKAQESRPADVEDVMTIPFALQTEGDVTGQARVQVSDWSEIPGTWSLTLIDTRGTPDTSDDVQHGLTQGAPYTFALDTSAKQRSAQTSSGVQRRTNDAVRMPLAPPRPDDLILAPPAATDTGAKAGALSPPRFQLQVETDGALPVEYARFDASINDRRVALNWATTSERGNDGFHVEHQRLTSTDSTTSPGAWQSLGFVDGANQRARTRAYQFETPELDYGTHAFRLRQVDVDGSVSYSQVLRTDIRLDRPVAVQAPYPNPVRQRATLNVTVRDQQSVRIQLYDILGRRVSTIMDAEIPAQETRDIQVDARRLASGLYFLRIEGDDFSTTERMTVVK